MSGKWNRDKNIDPLVSYAFSVSIGESEIARFSGVDGLSYEVEMIEYRDSASPNVVSYRQGRRKPCRVTMKRGFLVGGVGGMFFNWIKECEAGTVTAKNINVTVGDYGIGRGQDETNGSKLKTWVLSNARPVKWSLSSLDGNSNNAIVETIEFVVESLSNG